VSLDLILRVGTKLILLFALYVQFHGDYGPGGGFQAGVIAASVIILLAITFGLEAAHRIAPQALVERMIPLGVLIYAGTGVAGLLMGKSYLDYSVLSHDPVHGHELGIFLVEAGVLITVSGTMTGCVRRLSPSGVGVRRSEAKQRRLSLADCAAEVANCLPDEGLGSAKVARLIGRRHQSARTSAVHTATGREAVIARPGPELWSL
jgi:multicomponent Na+:H+ antiporter subunit B